MNNLNKLTPMDIIRLISDHTGHSLAASKVILENAVYPNFHCVTVWQGESYNATLTFITGDSHKVMATGSR